MKQGFGLFWKSGEGWCDRCTNSEGVCGNDPKTEDGGACFCSNWSSDNGTCVPLFKKGSGAPRTIIGVGSALGASFLLVCLTLYLRKNRKVSNDKHIEVFLEEYGALAPKRYSYSNVKKITKAFQEKLGQGGFGTVFKGTLSNGHLVAVKILKDTQSDGEEFINEVASICRTSHVNVVSLLGFCYEGSKRALIYDFMCNGSLEKLLYAEKPKTTLEWENLYRIAIGIARGLEYLHRGCNTRIVHFDIKPHNILLDQDFCPKISDFGLAKLCQKKDSIISIAGARGTIGYIAPEVFSRNFGMVSSKSDVYSYGMMVLEIAGGKKKLNEGGNSSEEYFPHSIYEHLNKHGNLLAYGMTAESEETVRKMILVGLWCIQTMPQNRPPINRVIEMLEGSVNDLQVPPRPYLSSSPLRSVIGISSLQDICSDDCSSIIHSPQVL
ncbi:LEAF RUST 10 DISEASE-RESISTANCE LOCUS RECEPTOR-LIKE PROTEIN KINASE-like 2.1 [Asparagus officinalis]|uniref:LEAF RUST 10 DISEASE-RESISTANCE LOCUS RECEPTOR-LIKE PROTEIN KINASE-like 2.1 n=1 Tax=Asparagus officinalis TaxID=4686 RepID=UPI00098E69EB|nr:LEAF RUST 10 DISEASE-RESISTANCE LOCUS RECEPTOR-LIKE PROTEIN KINASE-like 2.1 [Asparagus officinalis]